MRWVLLWVVLLLAAAGGLGLLGRTVWRKAKALTGEISQASERLAAVTSALGDLQQHLPEPDPEPMPGRRGRHPGRRR